MVKEIENKFKRKFYRGMFIFGRVKEGGKFRKQEEEQFQREIRYIWKMYFLEDKKQSFKRKEWVNRVKKRIEGREGSRQGRWFVDR